MTFVFCCVQKVAAQCSSRRKNLRWFSAARELQERVLQNPTLQRIASGRFHAIHILPILRVLIDRAASRAADRAVFDCRRRPNRRIFFSIADVGFLSNGVGREDHPLGIREGGRPPWNPGSVGFLSQGDVVSEDPCFRRRGLGGRRVRSDLECSKQVVRWGGSVRTSDGWCTIRVRRRGSVRTSERSSDCAVTK